MMNGGNIPDDVKRFILVSIASVPHLEAILLLRKEKTRDWNSSQLAQRLYVSEKTADDLLSELHTAGILAEDDDSSGYRFQPQSQELVQMIDRLADIYARNLVEVTNLIHSKTSKNAQRFADAFIWRKDP
ncbi:hypothetical protein [Herbaspirillum sp. ST 5-3]|uniref:hypothetical protein n=1 Tax=Oxalobacteraceae TaxID=75682 RepID=UPI002000591B|nr:hypothetical protein [Herbaspirillum sp. ST 5-3]